MKYFNSVLLLVLAVMPFQLSYSQDCEATVLNARHEQNDTTIIPYSIHSPTNIWKTDVMLGRVKDRNTYKPIKGAKVVLLKGYNKPEIETTTDEKGNFQIEKERLIQMEYHLRISHPQYKCLFIKGYILREHPKNVISVTFKMKGTKQR